MLQSYGLYKKVRDASWQALIDNNITSLPVDVVKVAKANGIILLRNSVAQKLAPDESGISLYDGTKWYIVYDDTHPIGRKRFTVAHELGHIFLGHPLIAGFHARSQCNSIPKTEREANIFASRFLCPSCVLWALNLRTPSEISAACEVSTEAAQIRATRMKELYKREKFLTSDLERKVFKNFEPFIQTQKSRS